jgi:hypothetical protein
VLSAKLVLNGLPHKSVVGIVDLEGFWSLLFLTTAVRKENVKVQAALDDLNVQRASDAADYAAMKNTLR